jgi:hypothetical protein
VRSVPEIAPDTRIGSAISGSFPFGTFPNDVEQLSGSQLATPRRPSFQDRHDFGNR